MSEATDVVDRQVAAYRDRDLERFLACYAADAKVKDFDGNVLMDGLEAMRGAGSSWPGSRPRSISPWSTGCGMGSFTTSSCSCEAGRAEHGLAVAAAGQEAKRCRSSRSSNGDTIGLRPPPLNTRDRPEHATLLEADRRSGPGLTRTCQAGAAAAMAMSTAS